MFTLCEVARELFGVTLRAKGQRNEYMNILPLNWGIENFLEMGGMYSGRLPAGCVFAAMIVLHCFLGSKYREEVGENYFKKFSKSWEGVNSFLSYYICRSI